MTRINCIPVEILTDQHLQAEYREITRVSSLARPLASHEEVTSYRMGTGHVKFFYDKGHYLALRTMELLDELRRRGFSWQVKVYKKHRPGLNNPYEPSPTDLMTNIERLRARVLEGPGKHTFWGQPINYLHYGDGE